MTPTLALTAAVSFFLGTLFVIVPVTWVELRRHGWRNDR